MAKPSRAQREAARKRLDEERARQQAEQRRRTTIAAVVGAVAVVAVLGAIVWGLSGEDEDYAEAARPDAVTEVAGGVALTGSDPSATAPSGVPLVEVFTDFLCPVCATFEASAGPVLDELVAEEQARVVYHPMNVIGRNLGLDSSTRIGGAAGCASDAGVFEGFRDVAFVNQPVTGEEVSRDEIIAWVEQTDIGADERDTFEQCVRDDRYVDWVKQEHSAAGDRGINSTPTVLVDGRELTRDPNEYTPDGLRQAVEAASTQESR